MNRSGHESADFFFGSEVEHTPALDMKTLFVVGYHTQEKIDTILNDPFASVGGQVKHIFFGANDSYRPTSNGDYTAWENVIMTFLDRGYFCSLDIPFEYVEEFHEGGLCERDRFIPIIKVPIPYIKLWNYNTCVKIDDRDFAATNPGVWVHQLQDLTKRDRFTDWSAYEKDQLIDNKPNGTEIMQSSYPGVLDSQYPDGDDYWKS
jgi:hypothetical protein